tara:strand:- start:2690 stop:2992 length:303 start_codon:yes stop_codon:yes gene_type:complete
MKNEDKKMYVVRGSEDGNLGVFSNLKKAYAVAVQYKESGYEGTTNKNTDPLKSYSKVCKQFKEHDDFWSWAVGIVDKDKLDGYEYSSNATIEKYYLNNTN